MIDESPQLSAGYSLLEEVTRWLFRQVAEGIRHLHVEMKIAHRDIKPDNIMYVTAKGGGLLGDDAIDDKELDKVKIGDFTVAFELGDKEKKISDR
jgi:serine/threonine protein kinase